VVWVEFENDSVFLKGGKSEWVRKGVREAGHRLGEAWRQIGCVDEVKYLTPNKLGCKPDKGRKCKTI